MIKWPFIITLPVFFVKLCVELVSTCVTMQDNYMPGGVTSHSIIDLDAVHKAIVEIESG